MVDVPPVSSPYICEQATLSCRFDVERLIAQAQAAPAPQPATPPQLQHQPHLRQQPQPPSQPNRPPSPKFPLAGVVELRAEQQEYNTNDQVIVASGKVVMRFRNAILKADRLEVNLPSKKAIASGNVSLLRGEQLLRGERFDYDFGNDKGVITKASGEVYQPSIARDLNIPPTNLGGEFTDPPLSEKLQNDQPVRRLTSKSSTGFVVGGDRDIEFQAPIQPKGTLTRLRYRADRLEFDGKILTGNGVRLTNDPFAPAELEVRADEVKFQSLSSEEDRITASNARVTVDQGVTLPLVVGQFSINKLGQDNNPFGIGFDGEDRGGLFLESNIRPISGKDVRLSISPQYFLQRAIAKDQLLSLNSVGAKTRLDVNLGPATTFQANAAFTSFEPGLIGSTLRARMSLNQDVELFTGKHNLTVASVYRERTFNGTLGFQDIQSSLGAVFSSPKIDLAGTGINLTYLAGLQVINANTDRANLAGSDGRVNLGRLQIAANLTKSFRLWEGEGPPANERSTYTYSPVPVVPYLQLNTGIDAKVNSYSNGDSQSLFGFNVSLQGQIGHFVSPFFDYTGFNIGYSQNYLNGNSPYLFDRFLDARILTGGINQQLFGPVKVGVQASVNIDSGQALSTDYYLEYSRRTFGIVVRYNPTLQLGSVGFKLNDLDWRGTPDPF